MMDWSFADRICRACINISVPLIRVLLIRDYQKDAIGARPNLWTIHGNSREKGHHADIYLTITLCPPIM